MSKRMPRGSTPAAGAVPMATDPSFHRVQRHASVTAASDPWGRAVRIRGSATESARFGHRGVELAQPTQHYLEPGVAILLAAAPAAGRVRRSGRTAPDA